VTGTWLVTSGWTQVNCTFTTGSSVSGSYHLVRQTDATSRDFWVDGFRLEQGTSLTSYGAGKIDINGTINTPLFVRNTSGFYDAFNVQNSAGSALLNIDTLNNKR